MKYEHSAGAVIFRSENGQPVYLILHYEEGHWGCSKGHTENSESEEETARREIREETSLTDISFISGFREENHYFFMGGGQHIEKTVTFLLAKTQTTQIILSDEHIGFAWLPYEEARSRITFKNEKNLFEKAHQFVLRLH
jgi:bis(5'-nucleosidyl)-tetraphosphatase